MGGRVAEREERHPWTGARWASGEDFAPRPNTPRAVLVADLPPPETPESPAVAEPAKA